MEARNIFLKTMAAMAIAACMAWAQNTYVITGSTTTDIATEINAIIAAASGSDKTTVTVTGSATGDANNLTIDIPADVTVKWGATLERDVNSDNASVIVLNGAGTFEVTEGGSVINTTTNTNNTRNTISTTAPVHIKVSGGEVKAYRGSAIHTNNIGSSVTVTGNGYVTSAGTSGSGAGGSAINANGGFVNIEISGNGKVEATADGASAIRVTGAGHDGNITVSDNAQIIGRTRRTIALEGTDATPTLTVSGNAIIIGNPNAGEAVVYCYQNLGESGKATINILGGTVQSTGAGPAINVDPNEGAVAAAEITVSGGTVRATTGLAISVNDNDRSKVAVKSNAVVFAYGTGINDIIIPTENAEVVVEGDAAVIAWDNTQGNEYAEGTSEAIFTLAGEAVWSAAGGIAYAKGSNSGFIAIDGLTIAPDEDAETFREDHEEILGKDVAEVAIDDIDLVTAALADYDELTPELKLMLVEEKQKLDELLAQIKALQAQEAMEAEVIAINGMIADLKDIATSEALIAAISEIDNRRNDWNGKELVGLHTAELETQRGRIATLKAAEETAQDNAAIAAAKTLVEGAAFAAVKQADINTQALAKAEAERIIGLLSLNGVTATVLDASFTAAIAGTEANTAGTNGSYAFTVELTKGTGTKQTTEQRTLAITATAYVAPSSSSEEQPSSSSSEDAPSSSSSEGTPSSSSDGSTPILNRANPVIGAIGVQTIYYNLKGEPLGTTKPATPGVYIEKQGKQTKKITIR